MNIKKIITAIFAIFMAGSIVNAESDIKIIINNEAFDNQTDAVIFEDRVLVPMREIFEKLGATIQWDGEKREVTANKGNMEVLLGIGNNILYKNGEAVELDVAARIENDRTLVPIRAVSESFGAEVLWKGEERAVYISYEEEAEVIPVIIEIENMGTMKAELYPEAAPVTVENFVKLANEGFYDGLIFHRVIADFMIQGGGYDVAFNEKETDSIKGEFMANGVENDLRHERGVLSMARTMIPDSASSQFFIVHKTSPHLDGYYAAFGKLTDGFDVLDKIAQTKTVLLDNGMGDVPGEPVIIKTIRTEE